ncbi:SurA N-terminal domain-containing protein [Streptomyces sp. GC420]|uniref:SurA N-terminal domain-containing protein n=1 Tax=Streptomyces sp. GC420 TaxID=2697568 RepID=UPI0014152A43|nr:SurA N-terminal domain-containing protein [Streptomyces sp. GC420]NBM17970.1 hypothetical protein [Streptomyces sp. GC420]
MHRRRTALSVSAVLLLAGPLLTACGSEAHPGAAAVVGEDRIEVSALQAQVRDVREAQSRSEQASQLIENTGTLSRAKLSTMIFDRVLERAAADAGVTISKAEVQQAREAMAGQYGGARQMEQVLLQQNGIAPSQIEAAVREQVTVQKLAAALRADLGTQDGQNAVGKALTAASEALGVDVNPRYGTWDDKKIQLGEYKAPWLSEITKEARIQQQAGA